ncbi:hypothetical protein BZ17_3147 [Yersinia pseudotuberculosis IP 32953]|uniref:Uncharacterized protein n=1 Tax=Yersinia pseudotuberculosis serotype O:3 (strain YPIII) TaxID=502800 RepID=A0A0H3AZC1_YERPY|nr:hypothetical protein [Yersinia pseudotuberculosis]CQD59286.1 Uncharacterised protein [Yersinia intermedia]AJJ00980.1 hypothetical protein BZ21_2778 [Yersinia pseudotuberculosis]AJJ56828.1 hypothetical protein BZ17_3147 [Yersinia pseudotuberculosis IP 32953]AJJ57729.1 hypothetical protein BZ22_1163 [Yersinia pseudotuberculosis YPIII]AJJ67648.1 hypothetical protein BZ16_2895 [Yersinia pseudotuberculosis PB1/+]
MSIDLRCYTTLSVDELQKKLDVFLAKYPEIFPEHYILYKASTLGPFDKEISNEFGLDPESYFYISVSNKMLEICTNEIARLVKDELGEDHVIVLHNGEDLI